MSDHIEVNGRKYFEESYLILANNNTKRAQATIAAMRKALEPFAACSDAFEATGQRTFITPNQLLRAREVLAPDAGSALLAEHAEELAVMRQRAEAAEAEVERLRECLSEANCGLMELENQIEEPK